MSVGFVGVPIVPTFKGMSREFSERLVEPAKKAGKTAAKSIEDGLSGTVANLDKQVGASQRKLDDLDRAYEKSYAKQQQRKEEVAAATLKLQAAEEKYNAAVAAGKKGTDELAAVKTAKGRLIKANQDLRESEIEVSVATEKHKDQLEDLNRTIGKLHDAQADLNREVGKSGDSLAAGQGRMAALGESAKFAGSKLADMAQKYKVHATLVTGAIGYMAKDAMDYAKEAEQSYGAAESVFGEHADTIIAKSKEAAEAVGISGREYRELSSLTGAMLKNMGMPLEEVTDKSQNLVEVAADLAATYGGSTKDAVESVNALLRGEANPIEKYGVSIKKADVNARLAAKGLKGLTGEALKQAEAQELLGLLMEQTADAQGQFAREADTAANKQQKATAKINDAKEAVGTGLLPVMANFMEVMGDAAKIVGKHPRLFTVLGVAVGGLASAVVGLAIVAPIFTAISTAATAAGTSMWGYVTAQAAALAPIAGVVAGVAAIGAALWAFFTKTETGREMWKKLVESFKAGVDTIKEVFGKLKDAATEVYNILFKGDYTGKSGLFGLDIEDSKTVDFLFKIRDTALEVYNLLFKGDFTGRGGFFGLDDKSSGFVTPLQAVHETVINAWDAIKSFAAELADRLSPVLSWLGDILRDSVLKTLQSLWDAIKNIAGAFATLAQSLGGAFVSMLSGMWAMLTKLWDVIAPKLLPVLKVLGMVVGGVLVGAFLAIVKAVQFAAQFISVLADVFRWLVDHAVAPVISWLGNFVGFITANLIPALGAAADFIGGVVAGGFRMLADAVSWAWNTLIKPVFDGLVTVGKIVAAVILTAVITPIYLAWKGLSEIFKWAWDTLIKPMWDAMVSFAQNTLAPAITIATALIKEAWQRMIDFIGEKWAWVRDNVLNPVVDFFTQTLWPGIKSVAEWVWEKMQWLGDVLAGIATAIYDHFIAPVINGYIILWGKVQDVAGWVSDKWDWLGGKLKDGADWIDTNVFTPFKNGLASVGDFFQKIVEGIGTQWDRIKGMAARPVNFVIDGVFNNGILKVWNKVAGMVGLGTDDVKIPTIGGFATGGILPGYTPGRDIYEFIEPRTGMRVGLSGGEPILRPEAGRVLGSDWVDGINAAARVGGVKGVQKFLGGFASGGVIGSISDWVRRYYPMMQITSTLRNTNDYHGAGKAVDFSNGYDSTPEMRSAAENLFRNYGKGLLELIHSPFNHNVKHGKDVGDGFGFYGAGIMNQHRNHVHVASDQPLGDPKNMVEMVWDGAKAVIVSLRDRVLESITGILDPIKNKVLGASFAGDFGKIPGAFFDKASEMVKNFLLKKSDDAQSYSGAGGSAGSAESWREMAMAAMRRNGFNADDPAQVDAMIKQISSESGGDPGIAQQIVDINGTGESAGVGLLQIIPGTFAAHRDPELPDDRRDPWANMNAALRYYKSRYGNDLTTMWGQGHGYALGGILPALLGANSIRTYDVGGVLPHGRIAMNESGEDEFILKHSGMKSLGEMSGSVSGMLRVLGTMVPMWKKHFDVVADGVSSMEDFIVKASDRDSIEGINARVFASEVLGIFSDLPGVETAQAFMEAEKQIWDARDRAIGHLDNIAEKEKALAEARKQLAELSDTEDGMSKKDARKLADAEKKLEEAKADEAKAESEEKRAKATEKVSKAEENLARVREDLGDNAEKSAEKHAEDVKKANESVAKAESDLTEAKRQQAMTLDNIVLLSAKNIGGLQAQAAGFGAQLTAMGAPAGAVSTGLGSVAGALSNLASMAGPAGVTAGMAISAVKSVISAVKSVFSFFKRIVQWWRKAQADALSAWSAAWDVIAGHAKLLFEMGANVAKLQQSLVRGLNEQRVAEFELRVATQDRLMAEAAGVIAVAQARMALDDELERGARIAQFKLMGLHEDWDTYMAYQARAALGTLDAWSDVAISKLFEYEKARAAALREELVARRAQIEAEYKVAQGARVNARMQVDLIKAQERLITMAGKVAGVDMVESTTMAQVSKLMVEISEAEGKASGNWLGAIGEFIGTSGPWSNTRRGDRAHAENLRRTLDQVIAETGVQIDRRRVDGAIGAAAQAARWGQDPQAVLRAKLPELLEAERAMRTKDAMQPIWDAKDALTNLEREIEDFGSEISHFEKIAPLDETLKGLDYTIQNLDYSAQAFAEGNERARQEYLAAVKRARDAAGQFGVEWKMDEKYANSAVQEKIKREVTVHLEGDGNAEEFQKMFDAIMAGSDTKVLVKKSASEVAESRRLVVK